MLVAVLLLALLAQVAAKCDNACSGHGTCGERGICECYDNWGLGLEHLSGDCSQRICPFEFAWVDSPDGNMNRHKYAECSNRGICNRETGDCECFPGYEGKACARSTCPNDCSGHGECKDIEDQPLIGDPQATNWRNGYFYSNLEAWTAGDAYKKWDYGKIRACVCDPGYADVDCSKRMCQYGTDVMDQRNNMLQAGKYQVQHLHFQVDSDVSTGAYSLTNLDKRTFALTFKSQLNETFTTLPIVLKTTSAGINDLVMDVTNALQGLPNNVIDHVKVQAMMNTNPGQNQFAFFDQAAGSGSVAVTCTAATASTTAITMCDRTLYGIKVGTTVKATTTSGTTVRFGSGIDSLTSTTVAAITSGTTFTLASSVNTYVGQVIFTFSGSFQTSSLEPTISSVAVNNKVLTVGSPHGISYGAEANIKLTLSTGCTWNSGSNVLTCAANTFANYMVGASVRCSPDSGDVGMCVGVPAGAYITAYTSATVVTISPVFRTTSATATANTEGKIQIYWPKTTVVAVASTDITLSNALLDNSATSLVLLPPMDNLANRGIGGADQIGSDLLASHNYIYMNITFDGNNVQGPQHPLIVKDIQCSDGCTPKLTGLNLLPGSQNVTEVQLSDFNSYECGRRGKCDYTTGQCTCFSGYTGLSCNVITSLV